MTERRLITGLIDEIVAGAPHSTIVSDAGLGLKYQKEAVDVLRKLDERTRTGMSAEIVRERPDLLARELAPLFEGLAFTGLHGDQTVTDAIHGLQTKLWRDINILNQTNQAGFDHVAEKVSDVGGSVTRASWLIGNTTLDANEASTSRITGLAFDRRRKINEVSAKTLSVYFDAVRILYLHGQLSQSVYERAVKASGEITPLDSGEIALLQSKPLIQLIESGQIPGEALQVLNEACLLTPQLQAVLYQREIVEPPVGSLASLGVGLQRLGRMGAIYTWQQGQLLEGQKQSHQHLGRIHDGIFNLAEEGQRTNQRLAAIGDTLGSMHGSTRRSEEHLASAASSLREVVGSLQGITEVGEDLAHRVEGVDETLRDGFLSLEQLLTDVISAEVSSAERVSASIHEEGQRQAVFMEQLISAVLTSADMILHRMDLLGTSLTAISETTAMGVRAQIKAVHELRALRRERVDQFEVSVGLDRDRNRILTSIRSEVALAGSEKEYRVSMQRAQRALVRGQWGKALTHFRRAAEHDDTQAICHFETGKVLIRLKRYEEAQQSFQEAADSSDSDSLKAKYLLYAALCIVKYSPKAGLEKIEEAEGFSPDVEVMLAKVQVQWELEQYENAYISLTGAILIDGRVIFEIMHNPRFISMRAEILENVFIPLVEFEDNLSMDALYYLTLAFTELETAQFPPEKTKHKLREQWKTQITSHLIADPLILASDPYFSSIVTVTSQTLIIESALSALSDGIPPYERPEQYYFLASLIILDEENHEGVVRAILLRGLSIDRRANAPEYFDELYEEIEQICGEYGEEILNIISFTGGVEFRQFKNYIYDRHMK